MKKIILLCLLVIGMLLVGCTTGEPAEPTDLDEEVLPEMEDESALAGQASGNTIREYTYHTCNDTDGGENFYEAGTVTITYDLVYKDKATGKVVKKYSNRVFDYADRLYKGKLYERFCKPGFTSGQSRSPLGFSRFSDCPNGFDTTAVTSLSGRTLDRASYGYVGYCVSEQECVPKTCTHQNYAGGVYECGMIDDGCGGTVNCNMQPYAGGVACPTGKVCQDSACVEAACNDTDGGVDIYIKGTTTLAGYVNHDNCTGASEVEDFYCDVDFGKESIQSRSETCPIGYGCSDGACVEALCGTVVSEDIILENDILDCANFGLIVKNDDLTIDCAGHKISGMGSLSGILVSPSKEGITVKNCVIDNFETGISLQGDNLSILNNTLINNRYGLRGITKDSLIINNQIENNLRGIEMSPGIEMFPGNLTGVWSEGNVFTSNTVCNNDEFDFLCYNSSLNVLNSGSGNQMGRVHTCADGFPNSNVYTACGGS
jgi:hypothetical protein